MSHMLTRFSLPIRWLSCCSEPSAGLAPAVRDGCPALRLSAAVVFHCGHSKYRKFAYGSQNFCELDLGLGALCQKRYKNDHGLWTFGKKCSNSSSELSSVALLLFPSPPAQSSKSGNLRLPTGRKEGEVIDGVVFSFCKVLGGCGGDCQVRT